MACTGAPPDSAEILNPAPPHPVEILTNSQPGVEEDDDEAPMFPNPYADIDNRAIGSDDETQVAKIKNMKVTSNHADKNANLSFSLPLRPWQWGRRGR